MTNENAPFEVRITLKSGATITADVTSFTTKRSPLDGSLTGLEWEKEPRGRSLGYVNLNEVAAVVSDFRHGGRIEGADHE